MVVWLITTLVLSLCPQSWVVIYYIVWIHGCSDHCLGLHLWSQMVIDLPSNIYYTYTLHACHLQYTMEECILSFVPLTLPI